MGLRLGVCHKIINGKETAEAVGREFEGFRGTRSKK
jgi:hypothetical protein